MFRKENQQNLENNLGNGWGGVDKLKIISRFFFLEEPLAEVRTRNRRADLEWGVW